jgi:WD40 repeat protein
MQSALTEELVSLVKVWDNRWFILYAYVGHHDRVLCLSKHPFGPYIISSSLDRTIRVWSLEYGDVVDVFVSIRSAYRRFELKNLVSFSIKVSEPISHLNITRNYEKFMVMTTKCLQLWCIKHYCDFLTYIGLVRSASHEDRL